MRYVVRIIWFLGLLAAAAGSWLIWTRGAAYLPPNLGPEIRFAIALAPLIVWAAVPVFFWRLFARPATVETPSVRKQRKAVLEFLAKRGIRGRRARYAQPFFLVAGPPGSGKSSLLERCDMKFGMPVTIGNASWWVGPEAVFVETAWNEGSEPRDVFELLRSLRPKLPVNATLLVLSPADLTLADNAEQKSVAQALAAGLRELDELTGMRVPAYLLLAKTDLVPGFREFFDRYEPKERDQPWGFMLDYAAMAGSEPGHKSEIDRGFSDILAAMRVRHMEWLSRESDPVRCGHLQGFSAQIAALQRTISPLLDNIGPEQDSHWRGSLLRGIFLTSARQEPLSIDALLPELSRRFAMPRIGMLPPDLGLDEEDYGYFVNGVIKSVIIPEAGLALRSRSGRFANIIQALAIVLVIGATGVGAYILFHTFDRQVKLAGAVARQFDDFPLITSPSEMNDLPTVLEDLRRLEKARLTTTTPEEAHATLLGLSAGPELDGLVLKAERDIRINALVEHLAARLESQLVDVKADVATLRQRLAVSGEAGKPTAPLLLDWVTHHAGQLADNDARTLEIQGPAAVRDAGGLTIDPNYIDAARRLIAYKESKP
jgi:type VI protein secretion system component VasK